MSFTELGESPDRPNVAPKGNILQAFPPQDLGTHFSNGYRFLLDPCGIVTGYDPNYCEPGQPKMEPNFFGPEITVPVRMFQTAFSCSPVGYSDEELIEQATKPIDLKLWTEVDEVLVALLQAQAIDQTPFPVSASLAYAQAAGYLAINAQSGTGVIYGPMEWFVQLGMDYTIEWNPTRNAYTDAAGNLVIPHSLDTTVVYAFDSFVDIKTSEIQVLDEFMPGLREVNDRIVRAEQLYTVAVGPCVVGSFDVGDGGTSTPLDCSTDSVTICQGDDPIIVTLEGVIPVSGSLPVVFDGTIAVSLDCETDSITVCTDDPIEVFGTVSTTDPGLLAVVTSVSASISSVPLLAANPVRRRAILFNDSSSSVFVKFGTGASPTDYSLQLSAREFYDLYFSYVGDISSVWESANGAMLVTEFV